ncbi:SIMPL domain-containing protein [Candidatus Pristimantibacillus sp. PTI5]|uniref:SIMPL domain-containing protein n=1 Tax=Candidatus Pristimantibacillus sp. PTI5 TaxID=3400422 RepID=UPI003B0297A5
MNEYTMNHGSNSHWPRKASTIEVIGEGSAAAPADQAIVVLGAVTEGTDLRPIQAENANIMTAVIGSLLRLGIPRDKLQTQEYRIDTMYDFVDGKQIFRGYQVTNLIQVTVDQVDQTGTVVDTAVGSGANHVSSIRLTTARPDIYEHQALSLAVRDAAQRALTIANTLGVMAANVPLEVQQLPLPGGPVPMFKAAAFAGSAVTPIEPGGLTVNASVRAVYAILPGSH